MQPSASEATTVQELLQSVLLGIVVLLFISETTLPTPILTSYQKPSSYTDNRIPYTHGTHHYGCPLVRQRPKIHY